MKPTSERSQMEEATMCSQMKDTIDEIARKGMNDERLE
jgi:hypothetical protein